VTSARAARRRYVVRRLAFVPLALFGTVTASFLIMNLLPGDVARMLAGDYSTPEAIAQLRERLGLDRPLLTRYVDYLGGLVHGDLGRSYTSDQSVSSDLLARLPATLEIVLPSLLLAVGIGVAAGVAGAYYADRWPDGATRSVVSFFQAAPDYVVGLFLTYLLFFRLHVLPAPVGRLGLGEQPPPHVTGSYVVDSVVAGQWTTLGHALAHLVLPVVTLTVAIAAALARVTRGAVEPALASEYVRFGRASGLRERTLVLYALRDARAPLLAYSAIILAGVLGGVAILELIFNWPGIGQWALNGVLAHDIPVVLGYVIFAGAATLCVYLALDLLIARFDPRVTLAPPR
jgi:peptide/nickel transport system permease protein